MALVCREVRVESWAQLVTELHAPDLIELMPNEGGHRRSPYVFRGMDVAKWSLQTSLLRVPKNANTRPDVVERSLLRSFRKYASAGAFDRQSEWYVLAVAQHNGLPTRCLDWTASPLVGAHFACADEAYKHEDGVIWCLHVGKLRDLNREGAPQTPSLHGIAWVYDTRLLEQSFNDLAALDATGRSGELLLLWEPPSIDMRIAAQSGLLSVLNSHDRSPQEFLETHCARDPDLVKRIVVASKAKPEVRDMLDQNNMSERALFPGLPGLCSWLKRYYGTSW